MTYWYWLAIGWAVCGFLAYGRTLAYFQRNWPDIADKGRAADIYKACLMAVIGPIGLVIAMLLSDSHGFMWRLPPRKAG